MKKFYALFCFILTLLVCSTPLSAQDAATVIGKITPVTSLDQLKEGAQLVFYNAGRQTYIYEDTENGNLMLSADFQVMQMGNSRFMFTLSNVAANGNNVSTKIKTPKNLYVPQLESGKIVASSNAGDSFTFTLSATGTTYALQNDAPTNAGNINLKQGEGSSYLLSYQNNAYLFRAASDEVTNAYWNDFSAQGVLKFWVSNNATSDAGSKITFEAYNPHLTWVNIDVRRVDEQMNPIDTITVEAALGEELELPAAPENYTLESKEFEHYVVENTDPITVVYAKYRTTIIKMLEEGTDKLLQTDTLLTPKGTELTMPIPTDGLYVLVTKGYEEYVAEKDSVITLYFKFGLPFEPATIVDGQFPADQTKWYHIKLRGKYIAANADDPTQPCITVTGEPADNDLYLWTVTGDTFNGFYLYCRAYGAAMGLGSALSSDVENSVGNIVFYPYLTETPSAYRLSRNGTGYSLMLEGSENVYINEFGGVDNVVAYWVSENAAKDNGSRLEFEEVGIVPEGIDNVTLTPADNAVYDLSGRRVSNPSKGIYIINGKKVYLK